MLNHLLVMNLSIRKTSSTRLVYQGTASTLHTGVPAYKRTMASYVSDHELFNDFSPSFSCQTSAARHTKECPPCLSGTSFTTASFTSSCGSADCMASLDGPQRVKSHQDHRRLQRQLQQFDQLQQQQQQLEHMEQQEQQPQLALIDPLPSTLLALEMEVTELMHLQQQLSAELAAVPADSPLAAAAQSALEVNGTVLLRALALKAALEGAATSREAPEMVAWPLLQADSTGAGLLALLPAI